MLRDSRYVQDLGAVQSWLGLRVGLDVMDVGHPKQDLLPKESRPPCTDEVCVE